MQSIAVYIVLLIFLTGCSTAFKIQDVSQSLKLNVNIQQTTNQIRYVNLTAEKIIYFLESKNICSEHIIKADSSYSVIDEAWFVEHVIPEYNQFLKDCGMKDQYNFEKNDCDDYARAFTFFCRLKSFKAMNTKYTMAVADVYYKVNSTNTHAINAAIVLTKDGCLKLIFIEPQASIILPKEYNTNIISGIYYFGI